MTSQAVERHRSTELDRREQRAAAIAKSSMCPAAFKGKPEEVLLVWEVADALDLDLTVLTLNQFFVPAAGRVGLMAQLQMSLAGRQGHQFRWGDRSNESATVFIRRRGDEIWQEFTYTIDDARLAKLAGKDVWQAHPGPMLECRAVTRAIRRVCPEVLLGVGSFAGDEFMVEPHAGDIVVVDDGTSDGTSAGTSAGTESAPQSAPSQVSGGAAGDTDEADPVAAARNERAKIFAAFSRIPEGLWRQQWAKAWREAGFPREVQDLPEEQLEPARQVVRQYVVLAALDAVQVTGDEKRHAFISKATDGATESCKALTAEQMAAVMAAVNDEAAFLAADAEPPQSDTGEEPF